MRTQRRGFSLFLGSWIVLACSAASHAGESTLSLGKAMPAFSLKDTAGKSYSPETIQDKKALVLVFVGTECPINNAYMPRLIELNKQYGAQGVAFWAINANLQDTPERVAEHVKQNHLDFPVLKDPANKVADLLGAQRTPEVFLFDADRKLRYHGRIDDQFGINFKRAQPTRNDLTSALDEVLAGKPVGQPTTQVAGCYIARVTKPKTEGSVTYSRQVARIIQNRCQECHRPGQVGPFALMSYDDAVAWSQTIHEVLDEGRMPPWFADAPRNHFANDKRLTDEEKATFLAWLDNGMPRGDDKDLPTAKEWTAGWAIGKPDLVIKMPQAFDVPAEMPKGGIPYKRFRVKSGFTEDKWIARAEARPGAPSVVHHIIVFVAPADKRWDPGSAPVLCGTAPGDMPMIAPAGAAKRIPANSDLIFEMHYTPNGVAASDISEVGLIFAKEPPPKVVRTLPVLNNRIRIPPGADNHKIESQFVFPFDAQLLSFMPHMHLRGKSFMYEAIYPDGRTETLLSVPKYNFNWQSAYRLEKPIDLPKGTKIHCVAHFDNSTKNPNNPDPKIEVKWGDQTWEEMMIGWCDYAVARQPAAAVKQN